MRQGVLPSRKVWEEGNSREGDGARDLQCEVGRSNSVAETDMEQDISLLCGNEPKSLSTQKTRDQTRIRGSPLSRLSLKPRGEYMF